MTKCTCNIENALEKQQKLIWHIIGSKISYHPIQRYELFRANMHSSPWRNFDVSPLPQLETSYITYRLLDKKHSFFAHLNIATIFHMKSCRTLEIYFA